jgi:hypothetical protein
MRPLVIIAAAGTAALFAGAGQAPAQANRTFVSGHGSDSNPCSLTAPCRSFAQALTQTNAGGEITILDPAGYGSVTINKSLSIVNDGVGEAGVTVTAHTDAIDISIGANDVVNLRGLTLVGGGVGINGISFSNLGALNIQNCVIRGFTSQGLALRPQGSAAFNVSDTIVSNNNGDALLVDPSGGGAVTATFNRVQAIGSFGSGFEIDGLSSTGTLDATISNSTASNSLTGIRSDSSTGRANTQVMVVNTVVSNNSIFGIVESGANSATYLAKNTIAGNTTAFSIQSGALFSFGDNYIKSNGDDGGAIALVAVK